MTVPDQAGPAVGLMIGLSGQRLKAHPKVVRVDYPGLEDHHGHAIAKAQQDGYGPLLSLELEGGEAAARQFVLALELFILAQSLGGVESLCAIPATMTHASMTEEARREAGISETLIRISVGVEDPEDLVADLSQALAYAAQSTFSAIKGQYAGQQGLNDTEKLRAFG